ncbi:hypothetical protein AB0910_21850 [Streptomyces sp. NPDC047002]|uniref:hypothetical protein n=1 Tax=Streptomyces sp. NPDC047002 TaxID=3155475 RepID=UPI003455B54F
MSVKSASRVLLGAVLASTVVLGLTGCTDSGRSSGSDGGTGKPAEHVAGGDLTTWRKACHGAVDAASAAALAKAEPGPIYQLPVKGDAFASVAESLEKPVGGSGTVCFVQDAKGTLIFEVDFDSMAGASPKAGTEEGEARFVSVADRENIEFSCKSADMDQAHPYLTVNGDITGTAAAHGGARRAVLAAAAEHLAPALHCRKPVSFTGVSSRAE